MVGAGLRPDEIAAVRERVRSRLAWDAPVSDAELRALIEGELFAEPRMNRLTSAEREAAVSRLFHSFRGLDALQPLLADPDVTEIMIVGHDRIFFEKNGRLQRAPLGFESRERLEDLIQSIVGQVNRIVNEASPIVDARLPDGSRVHVVLPPVALQGPTVTIRRFPARPLGMDELVKLGAIRADAAALLRRLVQAKYNIFISGGTGSGKTTFLNALARWIPQDERIITIEDAAELQIPGIANLVSLETRNANTEGKGRIGMRELIRASLRMRPDRIIVGEVRGEEALDMLQAMNTGHEGSLSTGHANTARDMMSRLETMVLGGSELPVAVVRRQLASALDIVVHLSRLRDGSRRVVEISEIAGLRDGEVELNPLYLLEEESGTGRDVLRQAGELMNVRKLRGWLEASGEVTA
ncbi:pilus assembly protein CpaF [Cohnella sp. OV330]|uniref:CpaF family protein n=1 Tax=Cohnella sp. OV330 TaxID=1855288 RepID=UPI0008E2F86D|nr:CpaF family protein [Cohnella sp. OV330]SFB28561.1 pilus assembly protein CpaF [Cohnella sp. OV330]